MKSTDHCKCMVKESEKNIKQHFYVVCHQLAKLTIIYLLAYVLPFNALILFFCKGKLLPIYFRSDCKYLKSEIVNLSLHLVSFTLFFWVPCCYLVNRTVRIITYCLTYFVKFLSLFFCAFLQLQPFFESLYFILIIKLIRISRKQVLFKLSLHFNDINYVTL